MDSRNGIMNLFLMECLAKEFWEETAVFGLRNELRRRFAKKRGSPSSKARYSQSLGGFSRETRRRERDWDILAHPRPLGKRSGEDFPYWLTPPKSLRHPSLITLKLINEITEFTVSPHSHVCSWKTLLESLWTLRTFYFVLLASRFY